MSSRFASMRDALNKTGKPIFYSLAKSDLSEIASIGTNISNSWRSSIKVLDAWQNVRSSFQVNNYYAANQTTGWFNDPDFLSIGIKQLSSQEERSQFALWAIAKAPLLISANLTSITPNSLAILKNRNLIRINQDPTSNQAQCIFNCLGDVQVFGAPQDTLQPAGKNYYAAVAINWNDISVKGITVDFRLIKDVVCKGCASA